MNDSCSERKLEPGLAATYSKPSDLSTSTMKSEPGFSTVNTSPGETGSVSAANWAADGDGAVPRWGSAAARDTCCGSCAPRTGTGPTIAAAPAAALAAAPFRKPRRLTRSLDFIERAPSVSVVMRVHFPRANRDRQ